MYTVPGKLTPDLYTENGNALLREITERGRKGKDLGDARGSWFHGPVGQGMH